MNRNTSHGTTPPATSVADLEISSWVARSQRTATTTVLPALSAWTRQMERYPQLSAAAQGELVADYQAGLAVDLELAVVTKRGVREERRLRAVSARGRYAIEHIIASNFRLVTLIAREKVEERWGRERASELLPDFVGEANIALLDAARVFNPAAGPSFPTYAARVIRDRMTAQLNAVHPVRLPPSWSRLQRIANVRESKLSEKLKRPATRAELVDDLMEYCLQWAYEHLTDAERALPKKARQQRQVDRLRKQGMLGAIEHLDEILLLSKTLTALDAPLGDDGGSLMDILSEADAPTPSAHAEAAELSAAIAEVLATLPDRDREIIRCRFGFVDGVQWPYQRISEQYNVSAERIRQIEKAAVTRLRENPVTANVLSAFLDTQFTVDPE